MPADQRTVCEPRGNPSARSARSGKSALVALIGTTAAAALMVLVPHEESGRKVAVEVSDGNVTARHVGGRQYLAAYRDIVGVWTICDGDTANVRPGLVETEAGCHARLERQLVAHARPVLACVPALGDAGRGQQLIASVSLAYNIGPGGFCRSTAARRFKAGDWRGGCEAFRLWNKAGGRVVPGLAARREREIAICLKGLK